MRTFQAKHPSRAWDLKKITKLVRDEKARALAAEAEGKK